MWIERAQNVLEIQLECFEMPEKRFIWVLMNIIALRYSNLNLITFDYCWSAEFLSPLSNCNEFFFYVYYLICSVDYHFYFFYCSGSHGSRQGWPRVKTPESGQWPWSRKKVKESLRKSSTQKHTACEQFCTS